MKFSRKYQFLDSLTPFLFSDLENLVRKVYLFDVFYKSGQGKKLLILLLCLNDSDYCYCWSGKVDKVSQGNRFKNFNMIPD